MNKIYKYLSIFGIAIIAFLAQSLRLKDAKQKLENTKLKLKQAEAVGDSLTKQTNVREKRREATRKIIEKAYRRNFTADDVDRLLDD